MAFAELKDLRMHYEIAGPAGAPVLLFSNSLGTDLSMWDAQAAEFVKKYRVVRYDKRGHGQSSSPAGPYTIEVLGRDVLALLDFLRLDKVHFCGLSIGGQTGMWLGVNAANRLNKLVLSNTAAKIGATDSWNTRIETVSKGGMKSVAATVVNMVYSVIPRGRAGGVQIQQVLEARTCRDMPDAARCAGLRLSRKVARSDAIASDRTILRRRRGIRGGLPTDFWIAIVGLNTSHLSNKEAHQRFS
jgi:pimeloyl-ACP methyl ester carboxylesterase